jgi:hypothetical protein
VLPRIGFNQRRARPVRTRVIVLLQQLDQAEALFSDMGMDWWTEQAEGVRSIGSINGVLNLSSSQYPANNAPVHPGTMGRAGKSGLVRPAHLILRASLPPRSRLARQSAQPIPCPGIEPMASGENAVELVALSETL